MAIVYLIPQPESGLPSFYAEMIQFSPGSPPPRPHPGPIPPPNWRPEHPEHPIANPWPPYVDISPPTPQPPDPGEPPVRPAGPPIAGQLPQSELGGWMYVYSPQYQRWLWAWSGGLAEGTYPPTLPPRPANPLPPTPAPKAK